MKRIYVKDLYRIDASAFKHVAQYYGYKKEIENWNDDVDTLLQDKKVEPYKVERRGYVDERLDTWLTFKGLKKKKPVASVRPSEIQRMENEKIENRNKEALTEKRTSRISDWIRSMYTVIHREENDLQNMDATVEADDPRVKKAKKQGLLAKLALYKAGKEINAKRGFFSKLFNWAEDIRNYRALKSIRTSIIEDNGLTKKEFDAVYKFLSNKNPEKYNDLKCLGTDGKPVLEDDEPILVNDELLEEGMDRQTLLNKKLEKDIINTLEMDNGEEAESEMNSLEKDELYVDNSFIY